MCDARATATVFVKLDQMLAEIPDVWRMRHSYRITSVDWDSSQESISRIRHLFYPSVHHKSP